MLNDIHQPDIIFAPQGLGNHCDHLQTIDAVLTIFNRRKIRWYFDTPYVIRQPDAKSYRRLPSNLKRCQIEITDEINSKIAACAEYKSQIGFQFGGLEMLEESLRKFHNNSNNTDGKYYCEKFLSSS